LKIETQRDYYGYTHNTAEPFRAEILEVRPYRDELAAILLDKTIFYPEGGGQPSDRGTINGAQVIDVIEEEGEILHLAKNDESIPKPGPADLVLDCRRRRDFSVCHSGQHLISGILFHYHNIATVSVHFGDEICMIDVKTPELNEEKIHEVEEKAADIIEENHPIIVHICPPEDETSFPLRRIPPRGKEIIRVVEIRDLDFSPCCGTHLASTGEIGIIRILGAEKYKGMTRLTFIAGRRCLNDSRHLRKNAEIISRAISVPVTETGQGFLDFMEKINHLELKLKELKEESSHAKAQALAGRQGKEINNCTIVVESYKTDMDDILSIGKKAQKLTPAVFLLICEDENKFAAFCGHNETDLRLLFHDRLIANSGKGGGSQSFFQGSFKSKDDLDSFIKSIN